MTHEENNIGGGEARAGSDEHKISQMLSGLKRVEAPKDFDFHLKARIANAGPNDHTRASLFPVVKYAAPLALFLVVGAGIVAVSFYNDSPSSVVSGSGTPAPTLLPAHEATPLETVPEVATSTPRPNPDSRIIEKNEDEQLASRTPDEPGGGSRDSHPRGAPRPIMPPGNSAVKALTAEKPVTPVKRYSAKEALIAIGIDAEFEGNSWTVKTVKANDVAGILGVKPGDRIKTIEGNPVDQKTEFEGGIKLSRMQVQRDGATVDLGPQSKPK